MSARVLLVEDNADDVYFMKRASAKIGATWTLDVAADGELAIARLGLDPRPTHMLLDLKLPRRGGLEVLDWLRSSSPLRSLPVIVLTSSNEKSDRERAARLGIDLYLTKPVGLQPLQELLRTVARTWNVPCT